MNQQPSVDTSVQGKSSG